MDGRPTLTDCDEAGDYVVPNVLSPRDLVFRPDNMDETVPQTHIGSFFLSQDCQILCTFDLGSTTKFSTDCVNMTKLLQDHSRFKVVFFFSLNIPYFL